jgi:hypothetical protein
MFQHMTMALTIAARGLASVIVAGAPATPSLAASLTRIGLVDPRGNRAGATNIEGDRIDFFDPRGTRTGPRRIRDGAVETLDRSVPDPPPLVRQSAIRMGRGLPPNLPKLAMSRR